MKSFPNTRENSNSITNVTDKVLDERRGEVGDEGGLRGRMVSRLTVHSDHLTLDSVSSVCVCVCV